MDVLAAPYLAAGLLLITGGVAKTWEPLSLVRALRSAGLPVRAPLLLPFVRAAAIAEAALGLLTVVDPSRPVALAVAASYAGFTVFVLRALRSGSPLASCGCFGKSDTPPTVTHAAMTAALAMCAALVTPRVHPGIGLVAVTVLVAYLSYLVLAVLPLVSPRARTSR